VTGLVGEIAAASDNQLRDVEQVGASIGLISEGTQRSAAGSEESASASEQMNAQAQYMRQQIDILRAMIVGGKRGAREEE
jgi:methyl-accepting chemotaxis protein